MIPASFDYHAPASLADAIALLQQHGDQAKVLSGGQSLLPLLKLRLGAAEHLVDIGRIPGLEYIKEEGGFLKIGGRTRESMLERSDTHQVEVPDPVRHRPRDRGSAGAQPRHRRRQPRACRSGQRPSRHDARARRRGRRDWRPGRANRSRSRISSPASSVPALAPDEILTEIRIPAPPPKSGGAYVKLERKVGDFATAAAAAQVTLGPGGDIERAGIGLTAAGPMPIKAVDAERFLLHKPPGCGDVAEAARWRPRPPRRRRTGAGSVEYKREMARVLTARALTRAIERAGGR